MYEELEEGWANKQSSPKKNSRTVIIMAICMVLAVAISGVIGYFIAFGTHKLVTKDEYDFVQSYDIEILGKFDLLMQSLSYANDSYYEDIDFDKLDKIAALAVMNGIDDFTSMSSYSDLISNSIVSAGLGIIVTQNIFNESTINHIFEDSDSFGKLQRGDILEEIDGHRVINAPSQYISYYLKGEVGTTFRIKVKRGDEHPVFTIVKKEYYNSQAYYFGDLGGEINSDLGYINLRSFTGDAAVDFKNCITKFNEEGKKALVLDLRNNGGGSGDILCQIASYLVKDAKNPFKRDVPIMEFVREKTGQTLYSKTTDCTNYINKPIYILANQGSASASEALIGAMLYYGTGELIGETTYGKGVGQVAKVLTDNDGSSYKLNIVEGHYYVYTKDLVNNPTGKMTIHGVGFAPQYPVKQEGVVINMFDDKYIIKANELYNARG